MHIDNEAAMKQHMLDVYPHEGCGVIQNNTFIACKNIAKEPTKDFRISDSEYLNYKVDAIVHSHTPATKHEYFDIRTPSMLDMKSQKATNVPWAIVGCDGENVSEAIWWGTKEPLPLMERPYIPNVYDCLTLVADYYKLYFDITFPIVPRPPRWYEMKKTLIVDGIIPFGFEKIPRNTPINSLQHGDLILFQIQANYVNHIGVVNDEQMLFHQLRNRFPQTDHIAKWDRQIVTYLRHKDLK